MSEALLLRSWAFGANVPYVVFSDIDLLQKSFSGKKKKVKKT